MKQVTKFYISSFLKNQTYFTPVLILFLQAQSLDFSQIFWVFTIGSIFSFIVEIPTGIFADMYGRRRSIIISKFIIFASYISFGFSGSFWSFVFSQILFELGSSFRSGTETAYTFDFLEQNKKRNPSYTEVKGKQKFYARIGEALATALGGFIASQFGFNWVFFVAAAPAFLNFIMALTWTRIDEGSTDISFSISINHAKHSLSDLLRNKDVLFVTLNITIFTSVLAAVSKFIQPYMETVGIDVSLFGVIYSVSLVVAAISVRYSYVFQKFLGGSRRTVNLLSFLAFIPLFVLGFGFVSIFGVFLFFIVTIIENIRSPIENNEFQRHVESRKRATLGSILSLSKNLGKIAILPLAGFLAESYSMYAAVFGLGVMLLLNAVLFYIRKPTKKVA